MVMRKLGVVRHAKSVEEKPTEEVEKPKPTSMNTTMSAVTAAVHWRKKAVDTREKLWGGVPDQKRRVAKYLRELVFKDIEVECRKTQVLRVFADWQLMDPDKTGKATPVDVYALLQRLKAPASKVELVGQTLFPAGNTGTIGLARWLRVFWPEVDDRLIEDGLRFCREKETTLACRASAPPVVDEEVQQELEEVFRCVDTDGSGHVSLDELFAKGLIHSKSLAAKELGANGLDVKGFLVYMCPSGYRAFPAARTARDATGAKLHLGENGWAMAEPPPGFHPTPTHNIANIAKEDPAEGKSDEASGKRRSSIFGTAPDPLAVAAKMTKMNEDGKGPGNGPTLRRRSARVSHALQLRTTIG
jgi:hypothetical protein